MGYLMPNPSLYWYYLTHSWEDKGVHTFPKGMSPKGKEIVQLEFELVYYNVTVQHISHYIMRTPHKSLE